MLVQISSSTPHPADRRRRTVSTGSGGGPDGAAGAGQIYLRLLLWPNRLFLHLG
jgi:hypothetical protein